MTHLLISAAHKSSGKTTVSLGLCAALRARGQRIQAFKKGPDYIDPMWLGQAAGRPCRNLDFYTMERDEILRSFRRHMDGADLGIIEGNKGLYDGLDLHGSNSNAALATLLHAPVVLVIDARGMTRGIAPLILGYQAFNADIHIAGVILNQVGGQRHEQKLRAIIEHYTNVPVLGAVHRDPRLQIDERHLGLIPSNESAAARECIHDIAQAVAAQVDLERILELGRQARLPQATLPPVADAPPADLRIGIARDSSFGFYYPGDLEALRQAGAELIPFNTLRDQQLPALDGLFIGGGFPETHLKALTANHTLRAQIRQAIEDGLPVYAECGGLMYLARSISWDGQRAPMVGAIAADVSMHDAPQGRGYIRLQETADAPWPHAEPAPRIISAHEFHYSRLENLDPSLKFAYRVLRGTGIDGQHDGIVYKNVLANYAHLRAVEGHPWAQRFVHFVRAVKQARTRPCVSDAP